MYDRAAKYVASAGLLNELLWQETVRPHAITESTLLRETAWVILCSGFRESVVRRKFDYISLCFCDWESAAAIVASYPTCAIAAHASFRSPRKLSAIVKVARLIEETGFPKLKATILSDPILALRKFPFIGSVTVWHLAKNLGFDVAKPDRHLVRISQRLGFCEPDQLCHAISKINGEAIKVIDYVMWRFLADNAPDRAALLSQAN